MRKIHSAVQILREEGLVCFFRAVIRNFYSLEMLLLYRRRWAVGEKFAQDDERLHLFLAERDYLPVLLSNWPTEFSGMGRDIGKLEKELAQRWDKGVRCFVAERDGVFCGVTWVEDWRWGGERTLDGEAGRVFEYRNVFVKPAARGWGIGSSLLRFVGPFMAEQGCELGLSRVRPDRYKSMTMFEKCGFERVGEITTGLVLGREAVAVRLDATRRRK